MNTTQVSVGSLLGMGIVTGRAKWKTVLGVLASWVVTLPRAARLDEQLDDQAKQFLATSDKNRIAASERVVYLSAIFKWYGGDFESNSGSVLAALKRYWPEKSRALAIADFKIRYTDYDWSLNEQSK